MKDIIELARQAGFEVADSGYIYASPARMKRISEELQAFAALVRNAALEEAADVINRVDLGGLNDHPREQKLLADTLVLLQKLIRTLKESGK